MDILIDESIEYQLYQVAHQPAIINYYISHKGKVIDSDNDLERLLEVLDIAKQQDQEVWGMIFYVSD